MTWKSENYQGLREHLLDPGAFIGTDTRAWLERALDELGSLKQENEALQERVKSLEGDVDH